MYCILCKNKSAISYHRFPGKPELAEEWCKITGINGNKISSCTTICGSHFTEDCFQKSVNNRRFLKQGSIPSLHLTGSKTPTKRPKIELDVEADFIADSHQILEDAKENTLPTYSEVSSFDTETETNHLSGDIHDEIDDSLVNSHKSKHKSSLLWLTRHLNKVDPNTWKTLDDAKENYFQAMDLIYSQKEKIQILHGRKHYLVKKLKSYEALIEQLKDHNLLTDDDHDVLMVQFNIKKETDYE